MFNRDKKYIEAPLLVFLLGLFLFIKSNNIFFKKTEAKIDESRRSDAGADVEAAKSMILNKNYSNVRDRASLNSGLLKNNGIPISLNKNLSKKITFDDAIQVQNLTAVNNVVSSHFFLWLGIGVNYIDYIQEVKSQTGNFKFRNMNSPAFFLSAGVKNDRLGAEVSYRETSGKMSAPNGLNMKNGSFAWKSLSGEFLYQNTLPICLRVGLRQSSLPFILYDESNANLELNVNHLTNFSFGFNKSFHVDEPVFFDLKFNYFHPLFLGNEFGDDLVVKSQIGLENEMGVVYTKNESKLGLYWVNLYQSYNSQYKFESNRVSFLNSNIEIRYGTSF